MRGPGRPGSETWTLGLLTSGYGTVVQVCTRVKVTPVLCGRASSARLSASSWSSVEVATRREQPPVRRQLLGRPPQRRQLEPRVDQVVHPLREPAGEEVVLDQRDVAELLLADEAGGALKQVRSQVGAGAGACGADPGREQPQPAQDPATDVDDPAAGPVAQLLEQAPAGWSPHQ